ncbi:MAG: helix-turn-helix domain-containing protein [Oscillochloris sp.]|nr:helix-turn-helix domain-containing protein [Oscillochloris sp.]
MTELPDNQYLSLSAASKLLGVHSTTLRRWADSGSVPVYITPGGHRRFARSDIEALAARRPLSNFAIGSTWATKALAQTRSDLAAPSNRPAWMAHLGDEDREGWRRIGQQLMGIVLRYLHSTVEDHSLLAEARNVGTNYAILAQRAGMPLTAALQAALFFRDSLVDAAMDMPGETRMRPDESALLLRRISKVANEVHLAVAAGYEEAS